MGATGPLPPDHPMRLAWEAYKASDDFANTRRWAAIDDHMDGSLWAVFVIGWNARAAQLRERDAIIDEAMRLADRALNPLYANREGLCDAYAALRARVEEARRV